MPPFRHATAGKAAGPGLLAHAPAFREMASLAKQMRALLCTRPSPSPPTPSPPTQPPPVTGVDLVARPALSRQGSAAGSAAGSTVIIPALSRQGSGVREARHVRFAEPPSPVRSIDARNSGSPEPRSARGSDEVHVCVVAVSGFSTRRDRRLIEAQVRAFGGRVCEAVDERVTHLIAQIDGHEAAAPLAARTNKYLSAIVRGIPVVSASWLQASSAAGEALPVEPFLMAGDKFHIGTPARALAARRQGQAALFAAFVVLFVGEFTSSPLDVLRALVGTGGARVLDFTPASHEPAPDRAVLDAANLIVCDDECASRTELDAVYFSRGSAAPIVSPHYLFDCISAFAILEPTPYRLVRAQSTTTCCADPAPPVVSRDASSASPGPPSQSQSTFAPTRQELLAQNRAFRAEIARLRALAASRLTGVGATGAAAAVAIGGEAGGHDEAGFGNQDEEGFGGASLGGSARDSCTAM